jgi:hypothetical protein
MLVFTWHEIVTLILLKDVMYKTFLSRSAVNDMNKLDKQATLCVIYNVASLAG